METRAILKSYLLLKKQLTYLLLEMRDRDRLSKKTPKNKKQNKTKPHTHTHKIK